MGDPLEALKPLIWKRSFRARYVSLRIQSDGTLLVTIPLLKHPKQVVPFLLEKKEWVLRCREKLRAHSSTALTQKAQDLPVLRKQAKQLLGGRLAAYAERFGFTYTGVRFQWMKSRWGSCSSSNSISLNLALMYLPEELQDYVILHELCHTKIKNHSKSFWALLDTYTNQRAKELSKQMKTYKIGDIEQ